MEQPSLATPGMSEAMMKLATFWHDENADINSMDAAHVRASSVEGILCIYSLHSISFIFGVMWLQAFAVMRLYMSFLFL